MRLIGSFSTTAKCFLIAALAIATTDLIAGNHDYCDDTTIPTFSGGSGASDLEPGRWWNPDRPGHGWDFFWYIREDQDPMANYLEEELFIIFYTYEKVDQDINDNGLDDDWFPIWYGVIGDINYTQDGSERVSYTGEIRRYEGIFPNPGQRDLGIPIGNLTLYFQSGYVDANKKVYAAWSFHDPDPYSPGHGYPYATLECLVSAGGIVPDVPEVYELDSGLSGTWIPNGPASWGAQLWLTELLEHNIIAFFDSSGAPRWVVGGWLGSAVDGPEEYEQEEFALYWPHGYQPNANPTGPNHPDCDSGIPNDPDDPDCEVWQYGIIDGVYHNIEPDGASLFREFDDIYDTDVDGNPPADPLPANGLQSAWVAWAATPELTNSNGTISVGTQSNPVRVYKRTNLHQIWFDEHFVQGNLSSLPCAFETDPNDVTCRVRLHWFTEGNFPNTRGFIVEVDPNLEPSDEGYVLSRSLLVEDPGQQTPIGGVVQDLLLPGLTYRFELWSQPSANPAASQLLAVSNELTTEANPNASCSASPVSPIGSLPNESNPVTVNLAGNVPVDLEIVPGSGGDPATAYRYQVREVGDLDLLVDTVQSSNTHTVYAADWDHAKTHNFSGQSVNPCGVSNAHDANFEFVAPIIPDAPIVNVNLDFAHDPGASAVPGSAGVRGGSASYSIPIQVPPGRRGMQPSLALSYSSRGGNGPAGLGWSIGGLSSIHRCPATAAQDDFSEGVNYTNSDRLCLDGQRLMMVGGANYGDVNSEYRTEVDQFARITLLGGGMNSSASHFRVERKSGMIQYYGRSGQSGQNSKVIPNGQAAPISWLIDTEHDRISHPGYGTANSMIYRYANFGNGEVLISEILYTGRGDGSSGSVIGDRRVSLEYDFGPRSDSSVSYLGGGKTAQTKLLRRVRTCIDSNTSCDANNSIRTYILTHTTQALPASGRSMLSEVKECAPNENAGSDCRQPTTFTYNDVAPYFSELEPFTINDNLPISDIIATHDGMDVSNLARQPSVFVSNDFDGDGIRELRVHASFLSDPNDPDSPAEHRAYLASIDGDGQLRGLMEFGAWSDFSSAFGLVPRFVDFDNDGRVDVVGSDVKTGLISIGYWNGGSTWGTDPDDSFTVVQTNVSASTVNGLFAGAYEVADFDGDGLNDFAVSRDGGAGCSGSSKMASAAVAIYLSSLPSTPDGTTGIFNPTFDEHSETLCLLDEHFIEPGPGGPSINISPEAIHSVSDFDGNGLPDIWVGSRAGGSTAIYFASMQSGTLQFTRSNLYKNGVSDIGLADDPKDVFSMWVDINGDGLNDFLYIPSNNGMVSEPNRNWHVQLNLGNGHLGASLPVVDSGGNPSDEAVEFCHMFAHASGGGLGGNLCETTTSTNGEVLDMWRPRYASLIKAADYNSDGKTDLLVPNNAMGPVVHACMILGDDGNGEPENTDPTGGGYLGGGVDDVHSFCAPNDMLVMEEQFPVLDNRGDLDLYFRGYGQYDRSVYQYDVLTFLPLMSGGAVTGFEVERSPTNIQMAAGTSALVDLFGDGTLDAFSLVGCFFVGCGPIPQGGNSADYLIGNDVGYHMSRGWGSQVPIDLDNSGNIDNADFVKVEPADVMIGSENGLGIGSEWTYYPLSSSANRGPTDTEFYSVPARDCQTVDPSCDPYVDDKHFYFTSSMFAVSDFAQSNGVDGKSLMQYSYREAMYNNQGRGFQGYRRIIEDDWGYVDQNGIPIPWALDDSMRTTTTFHQKFPLAGLVERQDSRPRNEEQEENSINPALRSVEKTWVVPSGTQHSGNYVFQVRLASDAEISRPLILWGFRYPPLFERSSTFAYDDFGNITNSFEYQFSGEISNADYFTTATVNTIAPPMTAEWWVDRVETTQVTKQVSVFDGAFKSAPNAETLKTQLLLGEHRLQIDYEWSDNDDRTLESKTTSGWHDEFGSPVVTNLVESYLYDGWGNRTSTTVTGSDVGAARETQSSYSQTDGYFPWHVQNAEGHTIEYAYDPEFGVPIEERQIIEAGVRELTTRTDLDVFGQPQCVFYPAPGAPSSCNDINFHYQPATRSATRMCTTGGTCSNDHAVLERAVAANGAPPASEEIDALGRTLRSEAFSLEDYSGDPEDQEVSVTIQEFDVRGRKIFESVPLFSDDLRLTGHNLLTSPAPGTHRQEFDVLGRVEEKRIYRPDVIGPDGTVGQDLHMSYSYDRLTTNVIAGSPNCSSDCLSMSSTKLGTGQLRSTTDAKGEVTSYRYDPSGNVRQITDANGNVIEAEYHPFGFQLWINDPNMGNWTFDHNALGEPLSQVDANGQTIQFEHDRIGRMTRRYHDQGGSIGVEDVWHYDIVTAGQISGVNPFTGDGLLAAEERYEQEGLNRVRTFLRQHEYDSYARKITEDTAMTTDAGTHTYLMGWAYDGYFGRMKSASYPNGEKIYYLYDRYGYQRQVGSAFHHLDDTNFYQRIDELSPSGATRLAAVAGLNASNEPILSRSTAHFDSTSQVEQICVSFPGSTGCEIQDLRYRYDSFGNVAKRDRVYRLPSGGEEARVSEALIYDELHRLMGTTRSESVGGGGPTQFDPVDYDYDPVGNLTIKSDFSVVPTDGSDAYTYGNGANGGPNAVVSVNGILGAYTYQYDGNGNLHYGALDGVQYLAVTYDVYNLPISIARDGQATDFYYGSDNQRYGQANDQNERTYYVGKSYEEHYTGGTLKKQQVFIGDFAIVTTYPESGYSEVSYLHGDRLGSVSTITDENGAIKEGSGIGLGGGELEIYGYGPFGRPRDKDWRDKDTLDSAVSSRGFTQHEHIDHVKLIHMNGRVFDYELGRFYSVDPIVQFAGNSQSLNPYSYILNNPLAGTDPSGYCAALTGTRIKDCVNVTAEFSNGESETFSVNQDSMGDLADVGAAIGALAQAAKMQAQAGNGADAQNGGQGPSGAPSRTKDGLPSLIEPTIFQTSSNGSGNGASGSGSNSNSGTSAGNGWTLFDARYPNLIVHPDSESDTTFVSDLGVVSKFADKNSVTYFADMQSLANAEGVLVAFSNKQANGKRPATTMSADAMMTPGGPLYVISSPTDRGLKVSGTRIQSPALGVIHEVLHAIEIFRSPGGMTAFAPLSNSRQRSIARRHEPTVINLEKQLARQVGEHPRNKHRGTSVKVGCVTCTIQRR